MRFVASQVRARAPLRLGFGGGGTDLAPYCTTYGGVVLNATIDRFAYAHLALRDDGRLVFRADDLGTSENLAATLDFTLDTGLRLHRAVYRHMMREYCDGEAIAMSITTTIDVPEGSGLGASSALVVALIEAFVVALGLPLGPYDVAALAYEIERVQLGLGGGRQDQYAAAFGGFNFIEFLPGDVGVIVNPLRLPRPILNEFESALVICFSGNSRQSADIIEQQVKGLSAMSEKTMAAMHDIKRLAVEMKRTLLLGDLRATASLLATSWTSKKATASVVSTTKVDQLLEAALGAGAWAGKVSGAGGGGFVMMLVDPTCRHKVISALDAAGGQASSAKLTFEGAEGWIVPSAGSTGAA